MCLCMLINKLIPSRAAGFAALGAFFQRETGKGCSCLPQVKMELGCLPTGFPKQRTAGPFIAPCARVHVVHWNSRPGASKASVPGFHHCPRVEIFCTSLPFKSEILKPVQWEWWVDSVDSSARLSHCACCCSFLCMYLYTPPFP